MPGQKTRAPVALLGKKEAPCRKNQRRNQNRRRNYAWIFHFFAKIRD